jgi:DnaA family protein
MQQLPLGVRLTDAAVFETFFPGPNGEALAFVRHLACGDTDSGAWLWGTKGAGKSHLLQAACRGMDADGGSSAYLPMGQLESMGAEVLHGWSDRKLVAIDDIEIVAGREDFEFELFALFNGLQETGGKLLIASAMAPGTIPIALADLRSRLAWGAVFQLTRLDDDACIAALQLRARHRGLEMPDATARFLMRRLPRDIATQCDWLDKLDTASLAAQRKLTVPFVSGVLGCDG